MTLAAGSRLGPYEVVALFDAGGMDPLFVVYHASASGISTETLSQTTG